ncbi:MAG: aspartyl/asparaginyl beta-hydroxylase domain-containing protein [Gammaproteobacteria bacterium]
MLNFFRLAENLNINPLAHAVTLNSNKFLEIPRSIKPGQPGYTHRQAKIIVLRMTPINGDISKSEILDQAKNEIQASNTNEWGMFPEAWPHIYMMMAALRGTQIGRVAIAQIPPGKEIEAHIDDGFSSEFYQRYHVIINGKPGNWAFCGGEKAEMLTGEAWWFDCNKEHAFKNESDEPRTYLNLDIRNR